MFKIFKGSLNFFYKNKKILIKIFVYDTLRIIIFL
jgi:hypothetical protein